MIKIDCAYDEDLAEQLTKFLDKKNVYSQQKKSEVFFEDRDFNLKIIDLFLSETNKKIYKIKKIDSTSYLLSKEANIEDFGLLTCELCGLVCMYEEELFVHRRCHAF